MRAKNFWKAVGFLVLFTVIYFSVNIVVVLGIAAVMLIKNPEVFSGAGSAVGVEDALMSAITANTATVVIGVNILTLGILMLCFLGRKDKFIPYVGFKKMKWADFGLILILGVFMNFIIGPVLTLIMNVLPEAMVNNYMELMDSLMNQETMLFSLIAVSIMAPLFEEIVVRGIIFKDFNKALPFWLANIIQAIVFGVMHGNIIQGTYAFMLGLILGLVYYKYKSIWAPIGMHFAFNSVSSIGDILFGSEPTLVQYILQLGVGLAGAIVVGIVMKKKYVVADYMDVEIVEGLVTEEALAREEVTETI